MSSIRRYRFEDFGLSRKHLEDDWAGYQSFGEAGAWMAMFLSLHGHTVKLSRLGAMRPGAALADQ